MHVIRAVNSCSHAQPLTLLPLVALIFYDVSGGPFGIEVRLSMFLMLVRCRGLALHMMRRLALRVASCLHHIVCNKSRIPAEPHD